MAHDPTHNRTHDRTHNRKHRRGSVTAEFAFAMALFLVPFLAGTFDVAKYLDIGNILHNAAKEGVVAAVRGGDPDAVVRAYITAAGLEPEKIMVAETSTDVPGDEPEIRVDVAYAFAGFSIFPWQEYMPEGITASASARKE